MLGFLLITFILVCYGLSNMVVYAKGPFHMFEKWRTWTDKISPTFGEAFSCMMCFPFWAGAILSIINIFMFPTVLLTPFVIILAATPMTFWSVLLIIMLNGILSSGTTWILHNIEEYFENNK